MTDLVIDGTSSVRVNWSRWISDCPAPYCYNAWQVEPGEAGWVCNLCGWEVTLSWPADPAAIEYLLAMRPDMTTRNWHPGETLRDLMVENAEHGILPPEVRELDMSRRAGYDLMVTADEVVVDGWILPAVLRRREQLGLSGHQHLIEIED